MLYIFDVGGVVTTTSHAEEKICDILNMSCDKFMSLCRGDMSYSEETGNLLRLYSDGAIDTKVFWHRFNERSGLCVKTDWWHWCFHPVRDEGTYDIIRLLKKNGNRVVCGTNTVDSHYRNHIERGDYEVFDQTYASCLMGVSKPDADFWNIILSAEQTQPGNAVFIDDRKDNCDAAASLGIHVFQFSDAQTLKADLTVSGLL